MIQSKADKWRDEKRKSLKSHQIRSSNLKSFTDVVDVDLQTTTALRRDAGLLRDHKVHAREDISGVLYHHST